MGNPVPFRTKKGEKWSPWKAVIPGKGLVELGPGDTMTQEEASSKLTGMLPAAVIPTAMEQPKKSLLGDLFKKSDPIAQSVSTDSTVSKDTISPTKPDKPKPGELRKNGLSELSPDRLKKFRETIATAIASGNVSLDRALVSIFRDKVPHIAPEQYMLLSTGWELACEQYFVNGVPPAWIIILLGNALVCTNLYEASEVKPITEDALGRPIVNTPNKPQADK